MPKNGHRSVHNGIFNEWGFVMSFKKAEKKDAYLKIALTGPSGSGKTFGALGLAGCFGKKIACIDSENGSASLYSDKFDFDVLDLHPPFESKKYIDAINQAVEAGYEVLVIDSISHGWAGSGGLLDKKSALDSTGKGNSYTNWAQITKDHEAMMAAILHSKIHLIATMRSKQGYSLEEGAGGKKTVKKVGMEAIQRDGVEYEFTTVFDLSMSHHAQVSKDRTALFGTDEVFKLDKRVGTALHEWLKGKKNLPETKPALAAQVSSDSPPAVKINYDKIGETVLNGGLFAGQKIKDSWALQKPKALDYSHKIKEALIDHKEVAENQLWFVDYGTHKGHLPENFLNEVAGEQKKCGS